MLRWFWRWLSGLVILYATAFGAAIGISWFLGLDDEVKAWAVHNRPIGIVALVLSGIVYAMYVSLEEPPE